MLDLHYYNSGNNVAQDSRSFWDSAYVENSYIPQDILNGASLKLVHCVKRAIADWYPGTKMGFTEWGLMDNNSNASGVYVADMLGAFGKYGDLHMPGQTQGKTESGSATANDKYVKTVVSCHDLPAGPSGNYYSSSMHGRVRLRALRCITTHLDSTCG